MMMSYDYLGSSITNILTDRHLADLSTTAFFAHYEKYVHIFQKKKKNPDQKNPRTMTRKCKN